MSDATNMTLLYFRSQAEFDALLKTQARAPAASDKEWLLRYATLRPGCMIRLPYLFAKAVIYSWRRDLVPDRAPDSGRP